MADLGNLYFTIAFKDNPEELEEIKKRALEKVKDLEANLKIKPVANKTELYASIREALKDEKFGIKVFVDKAEARDAIRSALAQVGANGKFSADDLRAEKAKAARELAKARADAARAVAEAKANAQKEVERLNAARAAKAEEALARARMNASRAAEKSSYATLRMNSSLKTQMSLVGKLKNGFVGLYSVYMLNNFLKKLIDIGGEIANQRIALGAILQDTGKATEVYNKIQQLAIKSPFGVLDLNQYAKQLSAYSVPFHDLYDTMKRMADISAGVGVDMGRIILAYGQVKAAKFLKGTELRQFTEANIPMVDKLSERFSELKGKMVSAGEVLDMISKKQVKFEDVKAVLWELTDEGGMFHDMQEVLSESVKSKWKNFHDALDIMFGDIANSTSGILKGTAESLTLLTQHWRELIPAIRTAVLVYGTMKTSTIALNALRGKEVNLSIKQAMSAKRHAVENLRVAQTYRELSAEEKLKLATTKSLTSAEWKQLMASGALNKDTVLRLVALKKMSAAQARQLLGTDAVTKAEIAQAAAMKKGTAVMGIMSAQAKNLLLSLKALAANPGTWITVGLFAGMELWNKYTTHIEEYEQRIKDANEAAQEGYKNLAAEVKKFEGTNPKSMSDASLSMSIDELVEKLKNYSSTYEEVFSEAFKVNEQGERVHSLAEQYEILTKAVRDTADAYKELSKADSLLLTINEETGHWLWNDTLLENIEDYSKAFDKYAKSAKNFARNNVEVSEAVQKAMAASPQYAKAADGKALVEQIKLLKDYKDAYLSFYQTFKDKGGMIGQEFRMFAGALSEQSKKMRELEPDYRDLISRFKKDLLTGSGIDVNNMTSSEKERVATEIKTFLNSSKNITEDIKKEFAIRMAKDMKVKITFDADIPEAVEVWKKKIDELTDGKFEAEITTFTNVDETIDFFLKEVKGLKETMEKQKPALIKAGFDFSEMKFPSPSAPDKFLEQMGKEFTEKQGRLDAAMKFLEYMHISPDEAKKKKGGGSSKDTLLEEMKEKLRLVKSFYSEYKKWSEVFSKEEALAKVRESGLFDALLKGKENINPEDYVQMLEDVLNKVDDSTKDRREFKLSIKMEQNEKIREGIKKGLDEVRKELDNSMKDIGKRWDIRKQLIDAGMSRTDATLFSFGSDNTYKKKVDELADMLKKELDKHGLKIPLTISEAEAEKMLGGTESPLYKQYFELWRRVKDMFEKDAVDMKLDEAKILNKYKSLNEKIQDLIAEYREKGLGINDEGDFSGDENGLSKVQTAYLQEYREKLSELKSELLELSPIWHDIFGDHAMQSYRDLTKVTSIARQIIENAVIKKDQNGKPTSFLSSYIGFDGKKENIEGKISLLEKLRREIERLNSISVKKNPFKGFIDGLERWKKAQDAYNNAKKKGEDVADFSREKREALKMMALSFSDLSKYTSSVGKNLSEMFDAMGNESMAQFAGAVASVADGLGSIAEGFASGDVFGAAVATVNFLISGFANAARVEAENREALRKIRESEIQQARTYIHLLQQEQLLYKKGETIYGSDAYGKALNTIKTYRNAVSQYKKELAEGSGDMVQRMNDTQKVIDLLKRGRTSSVLSAERLAAKAMGVDIKSKDRRNAISEVSDYYNRLALAQKNGLNMLSQVQIKTGSRTTGALWWKKRRDVFSNILEAYPELIDKEGKLNIKLAESIIKERELDDVSKRRIQNAIDGAKELEDAEKQMHDYLSSIFGEFGHTLSDAITEAFRNGSDAAQEFGNAAATVIEKLASDMAYSAFLAPVLEEANKQAKKIMMSTSGDDKFNQLTALTMGIIKEMTDSLPEYNRFLKGLKDNVKQLYDLDIYKADKKKEDEKKNDTGWSASIKGVTETTADILASYVNAIRADVSVNRENLRRLVEVSIPHISFITEQQLATMKNIEHNTAMNVEYVNDIRSLLKQNISGNNRFHI